MGPMARCAADLTLLLDTIANPDPLEAGKAYQLDLPALRHTRLQDFRVLIDTDPLMPTDTVVRGSIEKLAVNLAKAGVKVERQSKLLPDFVASSWLYMPMLMSFLAASFAPDFYESAKQAAGAAGERYQPCRGAAARHRAQPSRLADGRWRRTRLRAQWRELSPTRTARRASIGQARAGPNRRARSIRSAATRARQSRQSCSLSSSSTLVITL